MTKEKRKLYIQLDPKYGTGIDFHGKNNQNIINPCGPCGSFL